MKAEFRVVLVVHAIRAIREIREIRVQNCRIPVCSKDL